MCIRDRSPDANGQIFSGSAIIDERRLLPLPVSDKQSSLVAFYTQHAADGTETQSMAYSYDDIVFHPYVHNPIIANPGLADFRDPKVFPRDQGGYGMVIACGDHVRFYHSEDLIRWRFSGSFSSEDCPEGVWECPDLFPLSDEVGCAVQWDGDDLLVDSTTLTRCDIPQTLMRRMRSSVIFLGAILARCEMCIRDRTTPSRAT